LARGRKLERIGRAAATRFHKKYDRRTLGRKLQERYHRLVNGTAMV
jgi:hypothetical protein